MRIDDVIWLSEFVEKLATKHRVTPDEVEQVLRTRRRIKRVERGDRAGEDLYAAGGQTDDGRYLLVYFVLKPGNLALVVSARDMTRAERRAYGH
jgi:uncharacterized DUF497 family protein